jgi:hypothetical protein
MKTVRKILPYIVALAISFGAGYYATPTKIETKTVVKTETVKVEGKTKIVYRDKITKPDGTIIEKEIEREDSKSTEETKSIAESKTITTKEAGLVLGVLGIIDTSSPQDGVKYGVSVSKRVLGSVTINGLVTDKREIGVGLGWSF